MQALSRYSVPSARAVIFRNIEVGSGNSVRILGVLLFVAGSAATAYATWATYRRHRPRDVLFALLAPIALIAALTGLLLAFVPRFFG
jgi:hypothetical protein